jgi:peptidoglycan hydrolase-like protein with peptidoglycan-binding domain
MYELLDKPAAIREIQKYLFVISDKVNTEVPRVAIDGIYGEETRNAVIIFQNLYDIDGDGTVDRITFDKMYVLYKDAIDEDLRRDYIITDSGFPISVGTQNNDVLYVHLLINELGKIYKDIKSVDIKSTFFSERSRRAVKDLEKIFRIEGDGEVDSLFLLRMENEIDSIRRRNEEYI